MSGTETEERFGISEHSFRRMQEALHAREEVKRALIFGSRAKGTAKHGSDVDLAIVGRQVTEATARELSVELNERQPIPYYLWHSDLHVLERSHATAFSRRVRRLDSSYRHRKRRSDPRFLAVQTAEACPGLV